MAENDGLPIKFFAKREIDNFRVEEGGSDIPPKWILTEEELAERSRNLVHAFESIRTAVIKKEKNDSLIPLVITANIIDDATAKNHRREVRSLFQSGSQDNVLGLVDADEILVKVESAKEADAIIEKLSNTNGYARALSAVKRIEEFLPVIVKGGELEDYKVKLIDESVPNSVEIENDGSK